MENESNIYKTFGFLIVFDSFPKIGIANVPPKQRILIGEKIYIESTLGDSNGFYDWLINPTGKIVGIRYHIFEELRFICSRLENFPYCEIDGETIKIYFSDNRTIDEENSIDQEFCGDRVFYSENHQLAMSFYIEGKSKKSIIENTDYNYGSFFEI